MATDRKQGHRQNHRALAFVCLRATNDLTRQKITPFSCAPHQSNAILRGRSKQSTAVTTCAQAPMRQRLCAGNVTKAVQKFFDQNFFPRDVDMNKSIFAVAIVAVGLAACGKQEAPKAEAPKVVAPAAAPAAPVVAAPAAAPADAAKDAAAPAAAAAAPAAAAPAAAKPQQLSPAFRQVFPSTAQLASNIFSCLFQRIQHDHTPYF